MGWSSTVTRISPPRRRSDESAPSGSVARLSGSLEVDLGVPLEGGRGGDWGHSVGRTCPAWPSTLGVRYANGEGVPQDNVEAHMWLNLAASRSSGANRERGVATRDRVAERMTPADLSEAQRRAREWLSAH